MTLEKPQNLKDIDDLKINKADKISVYTKTEIDSSLGLKADKSTTYTKTEMDNALGTKANQSATYTKTETDNLLSPKTNNIVGQVIYVATPNAPDGWLKCNGNAVSRTTYANLFAAIGTTYGSGDGSTTFNLPDLRGEFIRGWDDGRGVDIGRTIGSSQLDQMQGHQHTLTVRTANGNVLADHPNIGENGTTSFYTSTDIVNDGVNGTPRVGKETRPRNVALLVCIKY